MAFSTQLRLLLWKNLTLKKRKPHVLLFELFIPLVLFFILLIIRRNQPSQLIGDLAFSAKPLPSSGLMAVLQSFCEEGVRDDDGFDTYPNATLTEFLTHLNDFASKRQFVIRPGFEPKELESIPRIYRSIIEDPIAIHSIFLRAGDFQIKDLFKSTDTFGQYLKTTDYLSLSDAQVLALLETGLNMERIHDFLFGIEALIPNGQPFSLFDFLKHNELKKSKVFLAFAWIFDVYNKGELAVDIDSFSTEAVDLIITKESIKRFFCLNNTIPYISPFFRPNDSYLSSFESISAKICTNLTDSQLTDFTYTIRENFNATKISELLSKDWDYRRAKRRINQFFGDLNKFALFEVTLKELSQIAGSLPNDVCKINNDTINNSNSSEDQSSEEVDINPLNNSTSKADNATKFADNPSHLKKNNVEGLVRVFLKMQKTICGPKVTKNSDNKKNSRNETEIDGKDSDKSTTDSDEEPVNQFIKEQSLLLNMLYSNPTILFAPNKTGSAAHQIIQKANQTFQLLDKVTNYAHILLNVSKEMQNYLNLEQTQRQFYTVKDIRKDILHLPKIFRFLDLGHGLELLNSSISIGGDLNTFMDQLKIINNAACSWLTLTKDISLNVFRGFRSEEDLLDYFQNRAYLDNVTVLASVIFDLNPNSTSLPAHITYKIRQNATFTSTTALVRNRFWFPGPRNWGYYYYQFGFVWIQDILERAMISLHAGHEVTEPGTYLHQFPYPCHISDQFLFIIEHVMPLCMAISWVYSVSMLVQSIVYEKEQRLKEVMKTMGLNSLVHWLAWFMTAFLQMSITAVLLTLILKYGLVLTYSNPVLVFLYIEIFVIANIGFSFLVSVLYSKAKLAAACAGIIYFLTYVPCMYLAVREETAYDKIPFWAKTLASLLSTTAFGMGAKYFAFYEEVGVGVQWSNIATSPVEDDSFTLWNVMNMMVLDALLYSTLVWYIENVHPGTYGLPRPWYFPFTKSYWLGTPIGGDDLFCAWNFRGNKLSGDNKKTRSRPPSESINLNDLIYFEAEPINLVLGVSILNLVKRFDKGSVPAVNKLSVNLYEGQITSFLGHNGAGKTTTMSILTGLFPPTSGETHIYGLDIKTDMDVIRQSMGICPQHNVLFDELTVEEHLWFYSCLKDAAKGGQKLNEEITKMISDLSLPIKRGKTVESLSGGMKRKLSVAIAFIGDSKVVILDEPTAGVDPYTRRAIWDLILKYKKSRTILLSTHHMDEADVLSDRIAILSNGQIKCCGSPLFLKHNLGEGYHMIFVKNSDYKTKYLPDIEVPSLEVQTFVQSYAPTAKYLFETNQEIHFILPNSEVKNFVRLFTALENRQNLSKLNVQTFGLKNTTLEEIFLKVASNWNFNVLKTTFQQNHRRAHSWDKPSTSIESHTNVSDIPFRMENREHLKIPTEKVESKKALLMNQFSAIIFKRWSCTKRNWKGLFSQILLPAFFVCVAMSVALIAPKSQDMPPLVLSPAQYYNYTQNLGGNVIPYCERQHNMNANQSFNISSTFHLPSGVGATCVLKSADIFADNYTELNDYDLVANYLKLDSACTSVLVPGIKPRIFLPVAPTSRSYTERIAVENSTEFPPTAQYFKYYPDCQCSADGTGYICDASIFQRPPELKLITGDVLIDITGVGLGQREHLYYLHTTDMYRLRRYGAFTFGLVRDYIPERFAHHLTGQQSKVLKQIAVRNVTKVWFNNKGFHSMPTFLNALNNAILRSNLNNSVLNPSAFGITLINHPMVDTSYAISQEQILQGTDVLIAIFIIVAMSFVPASFVLFLVYERFTKAKHLQFVSGVNVIVYWTANYFWDMCSYVVPAVCCILILLIFDIPAYTSKNNFPAVVSLFLMYGWSVTPVMYPVSFYFEEPSTAYICLIVINLFVGITCIVTSFLLEAFLYFSYVPYLAHIHKVLKACFLMFPNYCLGRGLMDIAFNEYQNFFLYKTGQFSKMKSPFAWDLVTRNLIAMALSGFAFFIITLLCEYNIIRLFGCRKRCQSYKSALPVDEDCDVADERRRVLSEANNKDNVLRMTELSKVFKKPQKHLAVDRLCLDIAKGECFGLLGVNGAGKSTTFKMLTGDLKISSGDAIINQFSVKTDIHRAQQNIGYCPQFDALFDELTAREHLKFYARLRGVKSEKEAIETVLKRLELLQYADQVVRTYSGGTKRKLSAAIALISAPPIVFMDEPTTGMDPYTRRFLWDLILELVHNDKISVILTSHSMEECEALCSRVAILVNGRFTCLGSIQHLKNRFGDGYHIIARCSASMPAPALIDWFSKHLPSAQLRENNFNILQFEIRYNQSANRSTGGHGFSLAHVFEKLQKSGIAEYIVCQNTLDNLFVNLAKKQQSSGHFVISSKLKTNKKSKQMLDISGDPSEDTTPQPSLTHSRISLSEFGCGTSSTASTTTSQ